MSVPIRISTLSLGLLTLALASCQSEDEVPLTSALSQPQPPATTAVPVDAEPQENAGGESAPAPTPVASAQEEFAPPFPERVDFFVAPRRARTAQRGDEVVELRGFITPPDHRGTLVLLAINGTESPIAAGEEKMGVKVISIEQPKVVLQRGRNRWTETLE